MDCFNKMEAKAKAEAKEGKRRGNEGTKEQKNEGTKERGDEGAKKRRGEEEKILLR